ncbi:hypothetical protein PsorP6_003513 [Peronosclerospora sorghi]|uniref:Uncharacterized protein n=1 Tax=Peronosclerospora sorghi TaxID=230839 RepID=A0ACC0VPS4_9STRA|nr:hypothetical protein PsorP6_003513 [Peronosclerospora sorghi]
MHPKFNILKKRRKSKDEHVLDETEGDTSAMTKSKQLSSNLALADIELSSSSFSLPLRDLPTATRSRLYVCSNKFIW